MTIYKTTLVIYSTYPGDSVAIDVLARDAMNGDSICVLQETEAVAPENIHTDIGEFFGIDQEEVTA
jgi:hypothetical protein